ncbi:hypothetical protein Verru16b_03110 [Lacunisphaera limnophila]|uniref:DUF1302 domain-containing protein n=1 Tax=Lacunisphaera limnophila TaxID=1838286 RepID=A0A1D8AYN9_9BACT|nr:DUF1302 domain-containing protein [Lacunisphaera limnophila]AOS46016.1 hypothetical protein Verru16b_03110 [Lacunisphaera limnophila]
MNPSYAISLRLRRSLFAVAALAGVAPFASAAVFEIGELKGSFDTTLSVGGLYRLNDPSRQYYSISAGGLQRSSNADDGNLNYGQGMASFLVKASHDLQLDYRNAGLFVRGYYFNDFVNTNGTRERTPLSDDALDLVGEGGELLDAYVYYKTDLGTMPATFRLGQQVLSWGESTFIPNGINSVNPIDVAKLRTPGSELKEALLPVNMVSGSLSLTENLSLEAFYLLDWKRTRVDPPGTFFSTNDFVAKGGRKVYLGFGAIADTAPLGPVTRGPDGVPDDSGQYGVNFRYFAEHLNSTEFGLFYMNYHSRLPTISARTPRSAISTALVVSTATSLATANLAPALVPVFGAATPTVLQTLVGAALTSVPIGALPANMQPFYPAAQTIAAGARTIGFLTSAQTANYLIEFPEDIHLVGASFNTSLKGIAFQGELSYRSNQPLQVDDVELLFAALSSINPAFGTNNQLGNYGGQLNTRIEGFRRHKVITGQLTATKVGRGILGAAQSTFIAETGFVSADLPAKNVLRYEGAGTFVGGELAYMNGSGSNTAGTMPLSEPSEAFADDFSWGYALVGRLDYNNLFAGVNVSPLVVFAHDVGGNTPAPLGNFLHGRKTVTLGADFTYQNAWAVELRYVNFTGAGRYNLLGDRDYVSATLKYSF